jgi:hypothetical protein
MASWFAGLRPLAGARAACELPADAVVSLRIADGGEAGFPLLQVQGRQVVVAVPWRKTRSAPFDSSRLATFTARLRQDGILEPVTAAICQLAANSTSTAPRSTTPAGGGFAASPRPGSTPPPGAAIATSSPTPATCPDRCGYPSAAARITPSSCSPCPSSWPSGCTGKPARCSQGKHQRARYL